MTPDEKRKMDEERTRERLILAIEYRFVELGGSMSEGTKIPLANTSNPELEQLVRDVQEAGTLQEVWEKINEAIANSMAAREAEQRKRDDDLTGPTNV